MRAWQAHRHNARLIRDAMGLSFKEVMFSRVCRPEIRKKVLDYRLLKGYLRGTNNQFIDAEEVFSWIETPCLSAIVDSVKGAQSRKGKARDLATKQALFDLETEKRREASVLHRTLKDYYPGLIRYAHLWS